MIDEDKIIAYLLNELDEPEHEAMTARIREDDSLQQTVEAYRRMLGGFRAKRVEKLAKSIATYESTLSTPEEASDRAPGKKGRFSGRSLMIGLLILAGVALLSGFLYSSSYYSDEALARRHFLMPADPAVAGDQQATTFLEAVEVFFNAQDYERAGALLATIPANSPYFSQALYLMAHADFLRGAYPGARAGFAFLSQRSDQYSPEQQRRIAWNALISRLAVGEDIGSQLGQWADTPQGQALQADLDSFWRGLFHGS